MILFYDFYKRHGHIAFYILINYLIRYFDKNLGSSYEWNGIISSVGLLINLLSKAKKMIASRFLRTQEKRCFLMLSSLLWTHSSKTTFVDFYFSYLLTLKTVGFDNLFSFAWERFTVLLINMNGLGPCFFLQSGAFFTIENQ